MASSRFVLALIALVGYVNCQFDRNDRNPRFPDRTIADGCDNKVMDIFFLLDSSSSIWINDYMTQLQFARNIVNKFDIRRDDATRVGFLSYSDDISRPTLSLTRFQSTRDAENQINIESLPYRTGVTNTDVAIRYVSDLQEFREDITKVMVIVTDGGSRSPGRTAADADAARDNGFYVFVVGVGMYLEEQQWRNMANEPYERFFYNITEFNFLQSVQQSLPSRACSLPPIILRTTCEVRQSSEVYFIAADSAYREAEQLIDYFRENTRDNRRVLSMNYIVQKCNYVDDIGLQDPRVICDDRFSSSATQDDYDISGLVSEARRRARISREGSRGQRSQTFVVFVDDATMSSTNRGVEWTNDLTTAQNEDIQVVLVDLGMRSFQSYLSRMGINSDDIINYLGNTNAQTRRYRNSVVDKSCDSLNYDDPFNGGINK